jgi:membrane protein YdbS with pleckstrin-like domain
MAAWIEAAVLGGMLLSGAVLIALLSSWPLLARLGLVGAAGLLLVGLGCLAHLWPAVSYRHRWFRLDDTALEIGRGVIWRQVVTVPRSRVQHMDVNQGPIERRFGLAHLVVHTAGTVHASVVLDGLGHDTAVALRDHLLGLLDSGDGDAV